MKVEVTVLGSPSLIILMVSVDVKQHSAWNSDTQELCESRGDRPGLPSLIILMVSVDVKQHSAWNSDTQELCESRGDRPGLPVPNNPYGLCGRKATFSLELRYSGAV